MPKKLNNHGQESFFFDEPADPIPALPGGLVLKRPLVFFDLETTGLDQDIDRIVQFAFLKVNPDTSRQEWMELVNPGIPIPREASQVHNITDAMVKDKPAFGSFAPKIIAFLQDCDLSGFNIVRFDVPFLQAELSRNSTPLDLTTIKIVDAQSIFHKMEPRTLSAAYRFYCNGEHEEAHDAMGDVRVTLDVFFAQLQKYSDLPKSVEKLGTFCTIKDDRWVTPDRKFYWRHAEAVIGFGKHKGKTLQYIFENDIEYLKWMESGDFAQETRQMIRNALNGQFPNKSAEQAEDND
ncbi:MAG TPA: 3'-5' exonuclease [bacterium]|nr:3'-5' exonuclease [bacterium]HPN45905.1 3'-5' exonuclease [bacterium]